VNDPSLKLGALLVSTLILPACTIPECSQPDYTEPECRVRLENELARGRTGDGFEIRFQDPAATSLESWDARGLVRIDQGTVLARLAGPGPFALGVQRTPDDAPTTLTLQLENLDPRVELAVTSGGETTQIGAATTPGLRRAVTLEFPAGDDLSEAVWVRGELPCPPRYRIAITADVQTGRAQLAAILEQLAHEAIVAEIDSEPLLGLVILGDLSEWTEDDEFDALGQLLAEAPIPVAVTPGNHDVLKNSSSPFHTTFGPGNHSFNVCTTKVALLDTGSGGLARSIEGRLGEFLDRGSSEFLLLGTHYPPYPHFSGDGWTREDQSEHLMAAMVARDADLLLAGHNHALADYPHVGLGGGSLHEIIVGTGGANQGIGPPRFGYLRLTIGDEIERCFVEVPPPGAAGPLHTPPSEGMPYCAP